MYTPIQQTRLYEQLAEQIKEQVIKGEIKVGDKLPGERDLADRLGVSRVVVRESMKVLVKEGLVEVLPGRGVFIIANTKQTFKNSLDLIMRFGTAEGWDDLIEVREVLEPGIVFLCAKRATEEDLTIIRESVQIMDTSISDRDAYIIADDNFHRVLTRGTNNALISTLMDPIMELLHEQRKCIFDVPGGPEQGQFHHRRILEALERHDPDAARKAMEAHLQQVRNCIESAKELYKGT